MPIKKPDNTTTKAIMFNDAEADSNGVLPLATAQADSLKLSSSAGGRASAPLDVTDARGSGGGGSGSGGVAEALASVKAAQARLVSLMQNEYFCDDLQPPDEAFGWGEQRLRDFFENGGA